MGRREAAAEFAEAVGTSKEHVRSPLNLLVKRGPSMSATGVSEHGADVYRALTGAQIAETGIVDLTSDEIANDAVLDPYTWSLAIAESGRLVSRREGRSNGPTPRVTVDETTGQVAITGYPPG